MNTIRDYLANFIQALGGACNWLAGMVRPKRLDLPIDTQDGGPRPTIPK